MAEESPAYSCGLCEVGLLDDVDVIEHFLKVHGVHICMRCGETFEHLIQLNTHALFNRHHATHIPKEDHRMPTERTTMIYVCSECRRGTTDKDRFVQHFSGCSQFRYTVEVRSLVDESNPEYVRYRPTPHLIKNMRERDVTWGEILDVVERPEATYGPDRHGRMTVQRGKLCVVVSSDGAIVTVLLRQDAQWTNEDMQRRDDISATQGNQNGRDE